MNRREKVKVLLDEIESDIADVRKDVLTAMKQLNELQYLIQDQDEYILDDADNMMYKIESLLDDIQYGLEKIENSLL